MTTRELIKELQEIDPGGEMLCVTLNFEHGVYDEVICPQVFQAADIMGVLKTTNNLYSQISVIVL